MSSGGSAVRVDRVVAVAATLQDGRQQLGSGYLVTGRRVLTAEHCTRDKVTGASAARLRVIRASDGAVADVGVAAADHDLDVAVLQVADDAPWDADLPSLAFARVDQTQAGVLNDCMGIGFPLFQRDPDQRTRHTSEFHGTAYQTDEQEYGRLLMREPLIDPGPVTDPDSSGEGPSPWGGLSGALMFYRGSVIGVVVEHHPRQGSSALLAVGFERIAANISIRQYLGLPEPGRLPRVSEQATVPLAGLVEVIDGDDLPLLAELNPYRLGATPTAFGNSRSHGQHDPYVARTGNEVDSRLRAALQPGPLVLVVGPSKSGKTRTAFEAARQGWPHAHLLAPTPTGLEQLVAHPRLAITADPIVVWLDDLERFLTGTHPLTPALLTRLRSRPGRTIVLATLRHEQRDLLAAGGELARDTRQLLGDAHEIKLGPTSADPDEQAAARAAYPDADLSATGLGEQLAGAPALLSQYHNAEFSDPLRHAVMQAAIDWARVGVSRPIPGLDLSALASDALLDARPDLEPTEEQIAKAIEAARTPPEGAGKVAALQTVVLPDRTRGYRPFDYLVAADNGQTGQPRAIPDRFWDQVLARADPDDAFAVSVVAYERDNTSVAIHATRQAAEAGNITAMGNLGYLLVNRLDPPELAEARTWYIKGAEAESTSAMVGLGLLLTNRLDPPELAEARTWYQKAAEAGDTDAMFNLGLLLTNRLDPPELAEARTWFQTAAEAGYTKAMRSLGVLLASQLDPPELAEARTWYTKAAEAGDTGAMVGLGTLLADLLDPPELAEARTWYTKAAEAGDTDALFNLGLLLTDWLDPPELAEARAWYTKAAEAGNTKAMHNLGLLLADLLDPPELAEARTWYTKAAEAGYTNAMVGLGALLVNRLDPPELAEARTWFQKAAEAGNTGAMANLGILLADLLDPPELAEARTWFQKAAEAGNTGIMVNLGILLAEQLDPPELAEARTWYTKAAEAGNTKAMHNLGILLTKQLDSPELAEARTWFQTAAEAGNTMAMHGLGELLLTRLDPPELAEARTWYTKAAEAGNTNAMVGLGALLADWLDSPELAEACTWFQKAAEAGNTNAMHGLAELLLTRLDPPELAEARTWYTKAAEAGNTNAMHGLAELLLTRLDPPELAEARTWYTKAAEAGNTNAMVNLGIFLTDQLDPPELTEARSWLQKAADTGNTIAEYNLGMLCAIQGDADGASRAWHGVIEKDQENDLVIAAALALAAVSALQGEPQAARQLLDLASKRGWTSAATYATALDPNEHVRANVCRRLRDLAGDTDALNFLGIAAYSDRKYDDARSYWTRSSDLGDGVSPLLLRLTNPSSPTETR